MINSRNLTSLPEPEALKHLLQSLAVLEALVCPDWEDRYYSFDARWGDGEQMASMRNGSGDDWHLLFTKYGAILKGFDHESAMTPYRQKPKQVWPGVLDAVPGVFASFLNEPAFAMDDTTFCFWRLTTDVSWQTGLIEFPPGNDPDGSAHLIGGIPLTTGDYIEWASEYYERELNATSVERVFAQQPFTSEWLLEFEYEGEESTLRDELAEMGYPITG